MLFFSRSVPRFYKERKKEKENERDERNGCNWIFCVFRSCVSRFRPLPMALLKGERPAVTITPSSIKDDSLYAISFFLFAFLQETWTLVNSLSLFFFFLFQKIINACTQIFFFFFFLICSNLNTYMIANCHLLVCLWLSNASHSLNRLVIDLVPQQVAWLAQRDWSWMPSLII